tara:strand:+ start:226 stop:456 length:231 start_codon:yes stop_codon:yes gene_type:complete
MKVILTAITSAVITATILFFLVYTNDMGGESLSLDCIGGKHYAPEYLYSDYTIKSVDCDSQGRITVTAATLKLMKE